MSDTLFLSVAYIDRFLSLADVKRSRLQLVGVTCMLVASKYEEIYAPQVRAGICSPALTAAVAAANAGLSCCKLLDCCLADGGIRSSPTCAPVPCKTLDRGFLLLSVLTIVATAPDHCPTPHVLQVEEFCYITDNTYTREQVLEAEREVLNTLGFDITQPTAKTFLRRYIKAASGAGGAWLLLVPVCVLHFCTCLAHHLHLHALEDCIAVMSALHTIQLLLSLTHAPPPGTSRRDPAGRNLRVPLLLPGRADAHGLRHAGLPALAGR